MLYDESGISPDIVAERGYSTVTRREVPPEFKGYQRRKGLLMPVHSPDGITRSHQLRPDAPRPDKKGKPVKYETPGGSNVILDVHPRMREEVRAGDGDLWITEGIKKADALTGRGLPTVGLIGVWGWCVPKAKPHRLRSCWDHVDLKDRRAFVVYDSDVMTKQNVQDALEQLILRLEERGAEVRVCYLPDGQDGTKVGVDDYLVSGGTVAELKMLARRFEPQDLGRIRLSRDEKLKALVEDLKRTLWDHEWKGQGGHTDRDVYAVLTEAAARCGKPHRDGLRVQISHGTLQLQAKIGSSRTLCKSLLRLEEAGILYRDNGGRKLDKAGAFVLRASVKYVGGRGHEEGTKTRGERECGPGTLHLRASRLMWSTPGSRRRRGTVRGTRRVRQGPPPNPAPPSRGSARSGRDTRRARRRRRDGHPRRDSRRPSPQALPRHTNPQPPDARRGRDHHGRRRCSSPSPRTGWTGSTRRGNSGARSRPRSWPGVVSRRSARRSTTVTGPGPTTTPPTRTRTAGSRSCRSCQSPPTSRELYRLIGHRVDTVRGPGGAVGREGQRGAHRAGF